MSESQFNLATPPRFRGLHPDVPISLYHRHLPHWRQKGATYFVTFRLADALPQSKLEQLRRWRQQWELEHPPPRSNKVWEHFVRQFTRSVEGWMDEGYGECALQLPAVAELMRHAFLHFQEERYFVSSFVVMPNHCHVVVRPNGKWQLEDVLESWKGYVGYKANQIRKRQGTFWQDESYDQVVRDEEHLYRIVQYIGRNPAKAGLPHERWHRWIHPEWQEVGWGFQQ